MMNYFIYFPVNIFHPELVRSYIFIPRRKTIRNGLINLLNLNQNLLITDNSGNDISNHQAEQLGSGVILNVCLKDTKPDLKSKNRWINFFEDLNIRYYKPSFLKEPEFITSLHSFELKDVLHLKMGDLVTDIAIKNEKLNFLLNDREGQKIVEIDYQFNDNMRAIYKLDKKKYLGIFTIGKLVYLYNSHTIYKTDFSQDKAITNEMISFKEEIEKISQCVDGVIILLKKNEIERDGVFYKGNNNKERITFSKNTRDILKKGNSILWINNENDVFIGQEKKVLPDKQDYTYINNTSFIMDNMSNIFLMINGRIYFFDNYFNVITGFSVINGKRLYVDRNILFVLTEDHKLFRITVIPEIINNKPIDGKYYNFHN